MIKFTVVAKKHICVISTNYTLRYNINTEFKIRPKIHTDTIKIYTHEKKKQKNKKNDY